MADTELLRRIERAGAAVAPRLSDRDVERIVAGTARRQRRRTVRRGAFAAAAVGSASLALVLVLVLPHLPWMSTPVAPVASAPGVVRLHDGSVATPLETGSTLSVIHDAPERVELALGRGRARFEVVPATTPRPFSVQAGDVTVTVLGTVFTVERVADRIGVTVERGTVRVDWKVGTRELHRGESGWFPPLLVAGHAASAAAVAPAPADRPRVPTAVRHVAIVAPASESAKDLLDQADAERVAGRPEQGAALLRRLLRDHARDARAPLAAFTLGRLLLRELDQPRGAAAAFAQVRALAPRGPFAEDALAREVEAWQRVGDTEKVRARAREYVKLYPDGRRVDTVRILGELE
jgi:transmembrane sensor